jgi:hypothetical protein
MTRAIPAAERPPPALPCLRVAPRRGAVLANRQLSLRRLLRRLCCSAVASIASRQGAKGAPSGQLSRNPSPPLVTCATRPAARRAPGQSCQPQQDGDRAIAAHQRAPRKAGRSRCRRGPRARRGHGDHQRQHNPPLTIRPRPRTSCPDRPASGPLASRRHDHPRTLYRSFESPATGYESGAELSNN